MTIMPTDKIPARTSRLATLAATISLAASTPGWAVDFSRFIPHHGQATLTYSVEITGHVRKENSKAGTFSDDSVSQRLDGRLTLSGTQGEAAQVDNLQEQIDRTAPARQAMAVDMPKMQKIADACGDDEACFQAGMLKIYGSMSPNQRQALRKAAHGPAAKISGHGIGDWALDGKTACSLHAVTRESSSYRTIDAGEGYSNYVSGSQQRHGEGRNDCLHQPIPVTRASWNGDSGILQLDLPGLTVEEESKDDAGKTGHHTTSIPDISLDDLHWSGKGPQSGQQTRKVTAGDVPATMTIRWTFTPGKA